MRPTNKFIYFLIIIALTVYFQSIMKLFKIFFYVEIELLLMGILIEITLLRGFNTIKITRKIKNFYSLNRIDYIIIEFESHEKILYNIETMDTPPQEILWDVPYKNFQFGKKNKINFTYKIKPTKRGNFRFGNFYIRIHTFLGLLRKKIEYELKDNEVKIFPDLKTVSEYEILMKTRDLKKIGIRRVKWRGQGTEYESLREYQRDDDYKWIDWKSTAKFGKLISKEFQPDKNQSIYFMLDLGRNLLSKIGKLTKFDYILNTVSLFLYVAHSFNDKIGIIAFSNRIVKYIKPKKLKRNPMQYIKSIYNLQPEFVEANYEKAYSFLLSSVKKRSLIVTFTDLHDPFTSERIIKFNTLIKTKHLPLCVSIFDSDLIEESQKKVDVYDDLLEKITAQEIMEDHLITIKLLRNRGIITVNVPAKELSIATINEFLKIKARGKL